MRAMRVVLTGTGSPPPNPLRAGPSSALRIGDEWVLIDCGDRAMTQLMLAGINPAAISKLFCTHVHTDHTSGLTQFVIGGWGNGRSQLEVFGAEGTAELTSALFDDVYRVDIDYRLSLGRTPSGVRNIPTRRVAHGDTLSFEGWSVHVAAVEHAIPTVAFRFEHDGQSVVFSGDTTYCDSLIQLARGADLLVCEAALWRTERMRGTPARETLWQSLQPHHCTPAQAGAMAHEAGVKRLVLNHILPAVDEAAMLAEAQEAFHAPVWLGQDLMAFDV